MSLNAYCITSKGRIVGRALRPNQISPKFADSIEPPRGYYVTEPKEHEFDVKNVSDLKINPAEMYFSKPVNVFYGTASQEHVAPSPPTEEPKPTSGVEIAQKLKSWEAIEKWAEQEGNATLAMYIKGKLVYISHSMF